MKEERGKRTKNKNNAACKSKLARKKNNNAISYE